MLYDYSNSTLLDHQPTTMKQERFFAKLHELINGVYELVYEITKLKADEDGEKTKEIKARKNRDAIR